eukprot:Sspe_Gene.53336::Locus_29506_Transcript_1_1_Confidence_1.000_Length_2233::g.53336::m.53336
MQRSSAMREVCTRNNEETKRNSAMKSRSDVASTLFHVAPLNPSFSARKSRSTPKGLPARADEPRGHSPSPMGAEASDSRRERSRCHDHTWLRIQCDHRMGWARWRCVYPGKIRSTSRSAWSTPARIRPRSMSQMAWTSSLSHMRISTATWSFRDRPVCSFPATSVPITTPNSRSFAVCMSSSPGCGTNAPFSHFFATSSNPDCITFPSSGVMRCCFTRASVYALLPRMSCSHKRWSYGSESFIFFITSSTPSPKRPPLWNSPPREPPFSAILFGAPAFAVQPCGTRSCWQSWQAEQEKRSASWAVPCSIRAKDRFASAGGSPL